MKRFLTFSSAAIFSASAFLASTTLTSCDDPLSSGDTLTDTVRIGKLSRPDVDSIVVAPGGMSADIYFNGSYVKGEDFGGYYLLDGPGAGATVLDTITKDDEEYTGTDKFTVEISDWDTKQTWYVAAFVEGKSDAGASAEATFYPRLADEGNTITKFSMSGSSDDGIDVDGTPPLIKTVEDELREFDPLKYATNTGTDLIFEDAVESGAAIITPIGGAVVLKADATTLFTRAELNKIYNDSYQNEETAVTIDGTEYLVFAKGKSPRTAIGTDIFEELAAGDHYIVITAAKNVARIHIDALQGNASDVLQSVEITVYQPHPLNRGEPVYKKAK